MHGLEVLPDRSSVWASSRLDSRIYGWSLPDLKYIGVLATGGDDDPALASLHHVVISTHRFPSLLAQGAGLGTRHAIRENLHAVQFIEPTHRGTPSAVALRRWR